MKNMFYVSIEFKHSFAFESTPSKLSSDIIRGIITEIKYKIENVVLLFDWAGSIFSFFFLYVFVRSVFFVIGGLLKYVLLKILWSQGVTVQT